MTLTHEITNLMSGRRNYARRMKHANFALFAMVLAWRMRIDQSYWEGKRLTNFIRVGSFVWRGIFVWDMIGNGRAADGRGWTFSWIRGEG